MGQGGLLLGVGDGGRGGWVQDFFSPQKSLRFWSGDLSGHIPESETKSSWGDCDSFFLPLSTLSFCPFLNRFFWSLHLLAPHLNSNLLFLSYYSVYYDCLLFIYACAIAGGGVLYGEKKY